MACERRCVLTMPVSQCRCCGIAPSASGTWMRQISGSWVTTASRGYSGSAAVGRQLTLRLELQLNVQEACLGVYCYAHLYSE